MVNGHVRARASGRFVRLGPILMRISTGLRAGWKMTEPLPMPIVVNTASMGTAYMHDAISVRNGTVSPQNRMQKTGIQKGLNLTAEWTKHRCTCCHLPIPIFGGGGVFVSPFSSMTPFNCTIRFFDSSFCLSSVL